MQNILLRKRGIVLIFVILLLGGCASTGALHVTIPPTVKLSSYKIMLVHAESTVPDSSQEVVELESMIVSKIKQCCQFENVISGKDSSADIRLNANIVELKKVGRGARLFLGAFAGKAKVVVDVALVASEGGKTIARFKAEGKSSGGTIFAGTTSQAIERAVEQIVGFVQKNI